MLDLKIPENLANLERLESLCVYLALSGEAEKSKQIIADHEDDYPCLRGSVDNLMHVGLFRCVAGKLDAMENTPEALARACFPEGKFISPLDHDGGVIGCTSLSALNH